MAISFPLMLQVEKLQTEPALDSPRAWVVVAAAFLASFVSFGVTYSFGVFLKPMAAEFHARHFFIIALFSAEALVSCALTPLTGRIADRFGPRPLMFVGALLMGTGLLFSAQVHSLPLLFITYGIGLGAAVACIYIPAMAAVGKWFKVHRPIAVGTAMSGVGCGTLVVAPLAAVMVDRYGWRSAFTLFAWTSAVLLLLCAALLFRPPATMAKTRASIAGALRTRTFFFLYASLLFGRVAVYVAMLYLPPFADSIGITRVAGAALVGYIGGASIAGRLGFNALAARFGLLEIYRVTYGVALASFAAWLVADSYWPMLVFAMVLGLGYGGLAAMYNPVTASIFGVERLGELLGILFTGFGLGSLIGPPVAALLVDETQNYHYPIFVATAAAALAFVLVLPLKKHALTENKRSAAAAS